MADNLVFEESLNTEIDQSEFIQKRWIYVNDNNSQNYTSQVVIDSTPLSNAGGWINWSEGFIVMPLVVNLTTDTAANAAKLPVGAAGVNSNLSNYSWAFKNGFWNMINSMTVEFNNQNIIQQTPFLNVFRSFKTHTSWSQDDLFNEGMSSGYHPDDAGSWAYCNDYSATSFQDGRGANCGFTNNSNVAFFTTSSAGGAVATRQTTYPSTSVAGTPVIGAAAGGGVAAGTCAVAYSGAGNPSNLYSGENACNNGMRKRQTWTGYDTTNIAHNLGQSLVNGADDCNNVYRSYKTQTANGIVSWYVFAKLRLKDLADFFEKTPLLKGSTIRFYINTNQSIVNFTVAAGTITETTGALAIFPSLTPNSVNVIGGNTNPLMLSDANFGQGMSPLATLLSAGTYNLSVSIVKNTFSAQTSPFPAAAIQSPLTACRLYAPVYTMNPLAESKYLSLTPTKKIRYKDIFQYQFNNNAKGPFNFLVSNGISNIVSVLVVPFISKSNKIRGVGDAAGVTRELAFQSYLSPVSPSPAVPDPIMLTNFNILISGVNLFLNNEMYDFEAFREQLITSNQLNGSLTTGLASGLINEDMFSRGYRYYYGDCSRVLPSEEGVSRSVQIVGTNASLLSCDLMVFVEFMREITIDISTGARIE